MDAELTKKIDELEKKVVELETKVHTAAQFEYETRQDNLPRLQRIDTTGVIVESQNITVEINGKAYQINVLPL